ncbi:MULTISPECIES: HAMP domain-containing sensor histidine kinase [Fusobacterium]|jgi:two-component system sensor histidine kinase ArlS|uniref:histidine kinase n=1 Tax=Fusobacterium hominis TaxID=2764326 RepID=A0A7G9GWH8_9FUSO|nr:MULTISPECIES: HAMP domain-containing sensor histidine kinase [Fusobacterium]QNM15160.1 HAMP domain-containing histidine kinase [Fusobacterium hominis]
MLLKIKDRFIKQIPITAKVTLWYTFFIGILLAAILTSLFFISDIILTNVSQQELITSVNKIAIRPSKFESYDDGIFFLKYDARGRKLGGITPAGFFDNARFSPNKVNIQQKRHNKFFYYDMKLRGEHGNWVRGVFPVTKIANIFKYILFILSVMSPFLLFLIIYGGYKIIKNGFKPVEKISSTAMKIKENRDFSKRIDIGYGKDEIHKMAKSFNSMLDTLENSYLHEKQFSSDVSHELRTPISVIMAESSYGVEHVETVEEARESFAVIHRQSKRMTELLTQIMELTKLEEKERVPKEKFNISEMIEDIESDFVKLSQEKNILLTSDIESNVFIYGNQLLLERVIYNLLTNAFKFTKDKIKISLKSYSHLNCCIIEVEDNGIGIPKSEQSKIWDRFYQVEQSRNKNKNQGYGLGLSIVSTILKLHNGKIELQSIPNQQTIFKIILPIENM